MKTCTLLIAPLALLLASPLAAFNMIDEVTIPDQEEKFTFAVPYGFYSETTELAFGASWIASGYGQPQQKLLLNGFAGTNGSLAFFAYGQDTRVPFFERLYVDTRMILGDYKDVNSYRPGNPDFPGDDAGSNDSDIDDYLESDGTDYYLRYNFRYLLPIGHGKNVIHTYQTEGGLLLPESAAGAVSWNPFESGRVFLENEFFFRSQDFDDELGNNFESTTSGINWAIIYDNRDFYANPTRGSRTAIEVSRDFGIGDSDSTWTAVRFDYTKFISLGESEDARQRVIALNFWTSDVPTWDSGNRPPVFAGSTLGGWERMRAYPEARYNDRSAIYYGAEYRYTPRWNPFTDMWLVEKLYIPWWQWVAFAEVGRVADDYDLSELHEDMQWNAGAGVRMNVLGVTVRADFAAAEDTFGVQMTVGQPW